MIYDAVGTLYAFIANDSKTPLNSHVAVCRALVDKPNLDHYMNSTLELIETFYWINFDFSSIGLLEKALQKYPEIDVIINMQNWKGEQRWSVKPMKKRQEK